MERSKRTPTEVDLKKMGERLDRIERAIAQLASGLDHTVNWKAGVNGQDELQAILEEQREIIGLETRPAARAPERRERVTA